MDFDSDFEDCAVKFKSISNFNELADVLYLKRGLLLLALRKSQNGSLYREFSIRKKNGSLRQITAPRGSLYLFQSRLARVLNFHYRPKKFVHGFVEGKSSLTNAEQHLKQRWVANIDIKDFYHTINFGRVLGLFNKFFQFEASLSACLARLCTYNNFLPAGAPTSPVISNFIAFSLDKDLFSVAKRYRLKYTRYCDDITFSSSSNQIPVELFYKEPVAQRYSVSDGLRITIQNNGFLVNDQKTRVQYFFERQVVTGLVVNEKSNIFRKDLKLLRLKIYSWRRFGAVQASKVWLKSENEKAISHHIYGWLAYIKSVRGDGDQALMKLCELVATFDDRAPGWVKKMAADSGTFDVFLCHASEDKAQIAQPLYSAMIAQDITVFYDKAVIQWGDSIVEKINQGLSKCKILIPVLSPNFDKKEWPKAELQAAIALMIKNKKSVLPIYVDGFPIENYPLINDLNYKEFPFDFEQIAKEVSQKLSEI